MNLTMNDWTNTWTNERTDEFNEWMNEWNIQNTFKKEPLFSEKIETKQKKNKKYNTKQWLS